MIHFKQFNIHDLLSGIFVSTALVLLFIAF